MQNAPWQYLCLYDLLISRSLVINFNTDQAELYGLIHRVPNFGEDVCRFL